MESKLVVLRGGHKCWLNKKGEFHRTDGPAYEWSDGTKIWFVNNKHHRIEGPAAEFVNGDKWWYVNGKYIGGLVLELLENSPFGKDIHLGILAEYFAERGDFRLLDIVQPFLAESK